MSTTNIKVLSYDREELIRKVVLKLCKTYKGIPISTHNARCIVKRCSEYLYQKYYADNFHQQRYDMMYGRTLRMVCRNAKSRYTRIVKNSIYRYHNILIIESSCKLYGIIYNKYIAEKIHRQLNEEEKLKSKLRSCLCTCSRKVNIIRDIIESFGEEQEITIRKIKEKLKERDVEIEKDELKEIVNHIMEE